MKISFLSLFLQQIDWWLLKGNLSVMALTGLGGLGRRSEHAGGDGLDFSDMEWNL